MISHDSVSITVSKAKPAVNTTLAFSKYFCLDQRLNAKNVIWERRVKFTKIAEIFLFSKDK